MSEAVAAPVAAVPQTDGTPPAVAPDQAAIEKQVAQEIKKWKVKVNDAEVEVDEAELLKGYTHGKAAQQRMQQAAEIRKQAEEFLDILKKDPKKVLSHPGLGIDIKQFAEDILIEAMQEQNMSPEQRETRDMKRKLEQYETEKKSREDLEHNTKLEQMTQKYMVEIDTQIADALKTSQLPKTPWTVRQISHYLLAAFDAGFKNAKPKDVVGLVEEDYKETIKSLFSATNEDALLSFLGDDLTNKTVKAHLNKVKKGQPGGKVEQPAVGSGEQKAPRGGPSKKKLTLEEWREENDVKRRAFKQGLK